MNRCVSALVSAATFRHFRNRRSDLQFGDFDAEFRRAFDQVFPSERRRPLGGELMAERHGIMVLEQDEMLPDPQNLMNMVLSQIFFAQTVGG